MPAKRKINSAKQINKRRENIFIKSIETSQQNKMQLIVKQKQTHKSHTHNDGNKFDEEEICCLKLKTSKKK